MSASAPHRPDKLRVAIVGGGLGGTTAAILLQRAGFDVKVYEQAPSLARIGAGINLSPNVMKVIRRLGLEEEMTRIGILPHHNLQRDFDTGTVTYSLPYHTFSERYGAPHLIMHRGDLQAVLSAALDPGTLLLGKQLRDLAELGSCMRLSFVDGTSAEADLVIGADGINSRVRELLLGPEKAIYTGHVAYRSIFPYALLRGLEVADSTKWWAEESYFMAYFLTKARDEIYLVTGNPAAWESDDFAPAPATPEEFRAAFEGYHSDVQRFVEVCPGAVKWPVLYRDPYPLWSRGRIVLLGDSAHPMKPHMGQGAAMAMEDAAMLARCIEHFEGRDTAAAFRLYESQRFERTTRVKLQSDKHEWMRYGSDGDWLFSYDVFAVPLDTPADDAAAPGGPAILERT